VTQHEQTGAPCDPPCDRGPAQVWRAVLIRIEALIPFAYLESSGSYTSRSRRSRKSTLAVVSDQGESPLVAPGRFRSGPEAPQQVGPRGVQQEIILKIVAWRRTRSMTLSRAVPGNSGVCRHTRL
jgi:hypothetical protein